MSRKPVAAPAPAAKLPAAKSQDAYHHGDLRAALIAAAREALETMPPDAITLKSLALRLGVSQPAPYRHFQSRDALLAAVAADGFVRFRDALIQSQVEAPEGERFLRSCLAYLDFGRANRGVYRLMFASSLLHAAHDETLAHASNASFDFLVAGVGAAFPPDKVHATAVWIWSTLHGLVMLEAEGLAGGPIGERVTAADVIHQMMDTLRSGAEVASKPR